MIVAAPRVHKPPPTRVVPVAPAAAVAAFRSNVLLVIVTVVLVSAATPPPVDCPLPRDVEVFNTNVLEAIDSVVPELEKIAPPRDD